MIRKARTNDISAIYDLINGNLDNLLPRTEREIAELLGSFYVLEENGDVMACACLEVYSAKIAELRSVAVRKDMRGRGYGRMIIEAILEDADTMGIPEVLAVTSNREFFEQLNFRSCLNEKYALFWNGKPRNSGNS